MINLENNRSFKWYEKDNIYVKGYVYIKNKVIKGENLCDFFYKVFSENDEDKLKELNGCFSCVANLNDKILLISDRIASFPLYYSINGKYISDSLDIIKTEMRNEVTINDKSIVELLSSSYITGNETAYKEINIVDLGQYVEIKDNKIIPHYYFKHLNQATENKEYEELENEYDEKNKKIFSHLINSLENKTAIIPLSGGYDSRYIACMLRKNNYENVICYTYGDKNTYEVEYSKEVAKKLGYKWFFIEYNEEEWKNIFNEKFLEYCEFSHNYISIPHIQDYIALKKLKEEGIIDNNCIIVNGFCGDLPAGSFLLNKTECQNINLDIEWIVDYIYRKNYNHIKLNINNERNIKDKIRKHIKNLKITEEGFFDFMKEYEEWFTSARPCKWVVNSNRIYEFFGLEWRMPLWDNEFIDFFYKLDYENRIECKFYQKYIFDNLFIPYNVDFRKPSYINKKSIRYEKSLIKKIKNVILYVLNYLRIITGRVIVKRHDVNNYANLAVILSRRIKNKGIVNVKVLNAHQMMAIWWCENKYGEKKVKQIMKGSNRK